MLAALRVGEPSGLALLDDLSVALRATVSSHLWQPEVFLLEMPQGIPPPFFNEREPLISYYLVCLACSLYHPWIPRFD